MFITYELVLVVLVKFFFDSGDLKPFQMLIIPNEKKPEGHCHFRH